jgi:hypothetical protein
MHQKKAYEKQLRKAYENKEYGIRTVTKLRPIHYYGITELQGLKVPTGNLITT